MINAYSERAIRALNQHGYDSIAKRWNQNRGNLTARELAIFDLALIGLNPEAHILDLGCGAGYPIADIARQRELRLIGVDQSAVMLALARERFPFFEWIQSPLEDFFPTFRVDFVTAWDCMFHVRRSEHAEVFRKIRHWLSPGAPFLLTLGGAECKPFTAQMFGEFFYFDSHAPEYTLSLLRGAKFSIEHFEVLDPPDEISNRGRIAILARA